MITVEQIIEEIKSYNPTCDQGLIRKAYDYGLKAHCGQMRQSGEPYYTHPIAVARRIIELKMDDASVVAALLHDVVEDADYTVGDICQEFGEKVGSLVEGLTKLDNVLFTNNSDFVAENFRKLFLSLINDIRVLCIKLCDREHNMLTIDAMPEHKQRKKALETLEIFAPLAAALGMYDVKANLENTAFRILEPNPYEVHEKLLNTILNKISTSVGSADVVGHTCNTLKAMLINNDVEVAGIYGRKKSSYSTWRKLQSKNIQLCEIKDFIASL